MRKVMLAAIAAAAILAGPLVTRSEAMPVAGLHPVVDTISPMEKASCYRWGRFGWGWYRWCGYWGPRHYWGHRWWWGHRWGHHWGHRWWGHRWGHHWGHRGGHWGHRGHWGHHGGGGHHGGRRH